MNRLPIRAFRLRPLPSGKGRWLLGGLAGFLILALLAAVASGQGTPVGRSIAGQTSTRDNNSDALWGGDLASLSETSGQDVGGAADSPWQSVPWVITATILVLGALYAVLWGLRNVVQRGPARRAGELLQLETSVRLSNTQSLHQVRFGSDVLLVGASPAGLVVLATTHDEKTNFEELGSAGHFGQVLAKAVEENGEL